MFVFICQGNQILCGLTFCTADEAVEEFRRFQNVLKSASSEFISALELQGDILKSCELIFYFLFVISLNIFGTARVCLLK